MNININMCIKQNKSFSKFFWSMFIRKVPNDTKSIRFAIVAHSIICFMLMFIFLFNLSLYIYI